MKRIRLGQKSRFIAVGLANTSIDFGVLFVLRALGLPVLTSNVISTTLAFMFSFYANKRFTFRTTGSALREFLLFTGVTLFGLWVIQSGIIQLVLMAFEGSTTDSSVRLLVAKLIATVGSLLWNYLLYSRFVFNKN